MLTITVAQDGSGDFASVSEAVLAVPYACAAEIRIGPGVYREKLVCEKQDITLIGAGMESTRIVGRRRQAAAPGRQAYPHLPQLYRVFPGDRTAGAGPDH